MTTPPIPELRGRYTRRVPVDLFEPCWQWKGVIRRSGYGYLKFDGAEQAAHRVAYRLHVGPIPNGWHVDHLCHNVAVDAGTCGPGPCEHRSCWNPAHLAAVPAAMNSAAGGHPNWVTARTGVCRNGHSLDVPGNSYTRLDGRRLCAVCARARRVPSGTRLERGPDGVLHLYVPTEEGS